MTSLNKKHQMKATSNCKIVETNPIFPVISDILIFDMHLPPSPLISVVLDLVTTFKVTSNNIEGGRGGLEMSLSFPFCFQECIFRWKFMVLGECLNTFSTACS